MPGDLHQQTLTQLAAGLDKGDFSSLDVTRALLDRIESMDSALNAFITVTAERALDAAKNADAARAAGNAGALNGLPIVHKDIFCTRDVLTTCGSRMLENFVSPYDATVVERLANAGAVVLGKPAPEFFQAGLARVDCPAREAVVIGDDIVGDVQGAQRVGLQGILVRTGKFRESDLAGESRPDAVLDSIADFPAWWRSQKG